MDEHLRNVADEFERLGGRAPEAPTLSGGTAEEVRLILEAAERGASALMSRAGEQASDHVERVRSAADGLLGKLDALETELNGLLDGLRRSGERLTRGLEELQADAAAADGHSPSSPRATGAPRPPVADHGEPSGDAQRAGDAPPPVAGPDEPSDDAQPRLSAPGDPTEDAPPPMAGRGEPSGGAPPPASEPASAAAEPPPLGAEPLRDADEAGARLIALNMALGGAPREETARYLAEHYALQDPEGLLDDVYSRAER